MGFPIRRFTDQSLFAAPRDLSQRTTSFIASQRQGIRQTPFWHLIALIAKTPLSTTPEQEDSEQMRVNPPPRPSSAVCHPTRVRDSKRPVLLQTHPGVRAVRLANPRLVANRRQRTENGGRICSVLCCLSSVIRHRMRFLFTMSDTLRRDGGRPRTDTPRPASSAHSPEGRAKRLPAKPDLASEIFELGPPKPFSPPLSSVLRHLVEPDGIEPTTSCLQSTRSPN